jgi:hypothetical protein
MKHDIRVEVESLPRQSTKSEKTPTLRCRAELSNIRQEQKEFREAIEKLHDHMTELARVEHLLQTILGDQE